MDYKGKPIGVVLDTTEDLERMTNDDKAFCELLNINADYRDVFGCKYLFARGYLPVASIGLNVNVAPELSVARKTNNMDKSLTDEEKKYTTLHAEKYDFKVVKEKKRSWKDVILRKKQEFETLRSFEPVSKYLPVGSYEPAAKAVFIYIRSNLDHGGRENPQMGLVVVSDERTINDILTDVEKHPTETMKTVFGPVMQKAAKVLAAEQIESYRHETYELPDFTIVKRLPNA